ncbi:MAG: hypothetical protein IT323_16415, partial [Anaerolineae bacterium]|nr:hypothetical protein [Anaerolineae bacterium]
GIALGIAAGLIYAWQIDPRVVTDTRPAQLSGEGKRNYMVALSLAYAGNRDVIAAANRLNELGGDWQALADAACELAQSGYASTSTGLLAIRAMVELAASQGSAGCASALLPAQAATSAPPPSLIPPTATVTPAPTKTQTAEASPTPLPPLPSPSPTPAGDFAIVAASPFCDPAAAGRIEIIVRNLDDSGIPGVAVEVIWPDGRERFFTGLKPDRDPGYADYSMTPGISYQVALPGLSDRSDPLTADECTAGGATTQRSYRVVFERVRTR